MAKTSYKATALKAAVLSVLLYIAIPTIDDIFAIPIIAIFLQLPLLVVAIVYYAMAWILVALAEVLL